MIVVTGSRGLIGRALVAHLEGLGVDVCGFDVAPSDVPIFDGNSRAAHALMTLEGVQGVIDLAAVSRPELAAKDPAFAWKTNVTRAVSLCERVRARGLWYIYASSREVYGDCEYAAKGSRSYSPVGVYGRTKVAGEMGVLNAGGSVLRFSNVYGGLGDWPDRVVPAFVAAAIAGAPARLDHTAGYLDFVHISDAVAAICEAIQFAHVGGGVSVKHVATGVGTTLLRLAHLVSETVGSKLRIEPFARERVAASSVGLEKTIRYPTTLEAGLEHYVALVRSAARPFRELT